MVSNSVPPPARRTLEPDEVSRLGGVLSGRIPANIPHTSAPPSVAPSSLVQSMQRLAEAASNVSVIRGSGDGRRVGVSSHLYELEREAERLREQLEMREAEIMRLSDDSKDYVILLPRVRELLISLNKILMNEVPDMYAYSTENKEFVAVIQELDQLFE